ncbi:MAG: hypothetical protein H0T57_03410 [Rubrobacter sp.]|nr:hypothetical protein [Rubrobacter sp.]
MAVRSFKSSTSNRRSMDPKTADALKKEKAAQKKVEEKAETRSRAAGEEHENE